MLKLIRIILFPFTLIFFLIVKIRNMFFDKNIFKSTKVDAKVISIGNLTVGGSGKTPAVLFVSDFLKNHGKKVGVLSRGYLRKSKGYLLVSDGEEIKTTVDKSGDEIFLVTDELNIPTAVCERRDVGAKQFLKDVELDVIVLDDAYQHRWIDRDLDICMMDQRFLLKHNSLDQQLLPSGVLREPFSSIDRADIVIINRKFSELQTLPKSIIKKLEGKEIYYGHYETKGIIDVKTHQLFEIEEIKGQRSLIVSGIARPYSFLQLLESYDVDFTNKLLFPDHQHYTEKEIHAIRKKFYDTNAYSVITTQKDAVKLKNYSVQLDDIDIYYVKIELVLDNQTNFENKLLEIFN